MYKDLIKEKVTVVVSSRANYVFEYTGTLVAEDDSTIKLENVDIAYLYIGFKYETGLEEVIINKRYIISCDK